MPYVIQGKPATLPSEPVLQDEKHYVSLRDVLEQVGGSVTFDNSTKTATAMIAPWTATVIEGNTSVDCTSGSQSVPVTLTAPPFIGNDEMMVPFDFLQDRFRLQCRDGRRDVRVEQPEPADGLGGPAGGIRRRHGLK